MAGSHSSSRLPLTEVDPQPIPSPSEPSTSRRPQHDRPSQLPQQSELPYFPPPPGSEPVPGQGMALHLGPESQIPDHPASMPNVPTMGTMGPMGPNSTMTSTAMPVAPDVRHIRASAQFNLREYLSLRGKVGRPGGNNANFELEGRLRHQTGMVLGDLNALEVEIRSLAKVAENHRWRRWLVGGVLATFIPVVRKFFRRRDDEESQLSSNDTEYAFRKSKGILSAIKNGILGGGAFAKIAFFVFAVLYVFQNEVTIRVAKTLQKRVRKLSAKLERGDGTIDDSDMKVFEGWRWRVLLW